MAMSKVTTVSFEQTIIKHFARRFACNPEDKIYTFCQEFSEAVYDRCMDIPMADFVFRMHDRAVSSARLGIFPRKYYDAVQTLLLLPILMGESIYDVIQFIRHDDVIRPTEYTKSTLLVRGNLFTTDEIYLIYKGEAIVFRDFLMAFSAFLFMFRTEQNKSFPAKFSNMYQFITVFVFGCSKALNPKAAYVECFEDLKAFTGYGDEPCRMENMDMDLDLLL